MLMHIDFNILKRNSVSTYTNRSVQVSATFTFHTYGHNLLIDEIFSERCF